MRIVPSNSDTIGTINYKIGDSVKEIFHTHGVMQMKPEIGTVCYVHPKGRYYTVEFEFGDRRVRESYIVRSDMNPIKIPWSW